MIIVTLTFSNTNHQLKLGFKTLESATLATEALAYKGVTEIKDEFGTRAEFLGESISHITVTDPAMRALFDNEVGLIMLKRDNEFNVSLQQDPTLRFIAGSKNPFLKD